MTSLRRFKRTRKKRLLIKTSDMLSTQQEANIVTRVHRNLHRGPPAVIEINPCQCPCASFMPSFLTILQQSNDFVNNGKSFARRNWSWGNLIYYWRIRFARITRTKSSLRGFLRGQTMNDCLLILLTLSTYFPSSRSQSEWTGSVKYDLMLKQSELQTQQCNYGEHDATCSS